jgi:hypothetical protein
VDAGHDTAELKAKTGGSGNQIAASSNTKVETESFMVTTGQSGSNPKVTHFCHIRHFYVKRKIFSSSTNPTKRFDVAFVKCTESKQ